MSQSCTIAVIDDDDALRESMKDMLESLGYEAVAFPSASEFLESYSQCAIHCIISDVKMPGIDGLQLLEILNGKGVRTPLIFMTAFRDQRLTTAARQGGARGVLSKPIDSDQLVALLESAVGDHNGGGDTD
ncbi:MULTISPECIES: response regulator [unclassified Sinorhizobium]|uniref:response regulator transcription factor n=1 Tax=unclassified Sinorhizobium TaxID=2613772 RepID=UPI0024C375E1|nr:MULTISPECIES: response regulator [unclassified Sinorhizobium]MDK1373773.1 response regulator [Sinorhizobium sp. 6-70]MDK1478726.1 response regulator [Sinorhizobium sp. 6-117]